MSKRTTDGTDHPHRAQTDESLRLERNLADARAADKRDAVEEAADQVVRIARRRADQVVETARRDADRERGRQSKAIEASSEQERSRADTVLKDERTSADAALDLERTERKRYLADFLAVEREATDKDLVGERAQADTVIAARDEFLAAVSHDLRSLLGGISLNAELLERHAPAGPGGDLVRKHAATSRRLVARMNRLVNDLLDMASIEAGKLAVLPEEVEVAQILRDTLDAFEPIAAAKHIQLDADAGPEPLHARLDSGRLLQVLVNLVSNAIKFTPPEGRVSISVRAEKDQILFSVRDTGIGIPAHAITGVFERFRQVSPDRRGLGLGLHISKCIVEAHGGRMWAESQVGAGSTFHFALPASLLLTR